MQPNKAAQDLVAILEAENAALRRNDPEAAVALVDRKLAVSKLLAASDVDPDLATQLRDLAAANAALLEQAIEVQGQIITLIARAVADAAPPVSRYGAEGRTLRHEPTLSIIRQA